MYILVDRRDNFFEDRRSETQKHENQIIDEFAVEHAQGGEDGMLVVSVVRGEQELLADCVEASRNQSEDYIDVNYRMGE